MPQYAKHQSRTSRGTVKAVKAMVGSIQRAAPAAAQRLRVVVLGDQTFHCTITAGLRRQGFAVSSRRAQTAKRFIARLDVSLDLILVDHDCTGARAIPVLQLLAERNLDVPLFLIGDRLEADVIASMRDGASDFL